MTKSILLINGPNLNMLGYRDPEDYGSVSLDDIVRKLKELSFSYGYEILEFQSNSEGEIVSFIQNNFRRASGMIINAGAYTHTSIAIRDALIVANLPFVEVHLSNVYKRENFRHVSFLSDIALGVVVGFKEDSYYAALLLLLSHIGEKVF